MSQKIKVSLLTPAKKLLEEQVDELYLPSSLGMIGVLPHHAQTICQLGTGLMHYTQGNVSGFYFISGGVAQIQNNQVSILADLAEDPSLIDVNRAKKALERAQERLAGRTLSSENSLDVKRAAMAEAKALARLEAASALQNKSK